MKIIIFCMLLNTSVYAVTNEFNQHITSAKSTSISMNQRWNSLQLAAEQVDINPEQVAQIKDFSNNKDWYMRNASLVALYKINSSLATEQAKILLNDKALVVRSAAVDVVAKNLTQENKKILLEQLGKPYNFHKKSSLWIRKQIVEKIAVAASRDDLQFFSINLFDSDLEIAKLSYKTLEKITGQNFGESAQTLEKWKSLAKASKWL